MSKKEVQVIFETITPLFTGDAWQESKEIRPSSLLGSLRFWFEVLCYFSNNCRKEDLNRDKGRFEKEINGKYFIKCLRRKQNTSILLKIECLLEQKIPLPSIVFGTTGWKSLIEIKNIEYLEDYCFGNRLNLPRKICIEKQNKKKKNLNSLKDCENIPDKSKFSLYFFPQFYFYGKFKVTFLVEEFIKTRIFFPLLVFMDKYGYWGGKWNLGFGRLKIAKEGENGRISQIEQISFKFDVFNRNSPSFEIKSLIKEYETESLEKINLQDRLNNRQNKIKLFISKYKKDDIKNVMLSLIEIKHRLRVTFRENRDLRHKIFGFVSKGEIYGSKFLPYVDMENEEYKYGFLSLVDILGLEGS